MCIIYFVTVLLVSVGAVASSDFKGLGDLASMFKMLSGEDACNLLCPNGALPQPDPNHKLSSNGCGSMGIKFDVSEYPGFEECCNAHDRCYDTCNSDRDECDLGFKECLNNACDFEQVKSKLSADKRKQCNGLSELMYTGTVGLGCSAFKKSQQNACLCNGKKLTDKEMKRLEKMKEL